MNINDTQLLITLHLFEHNHTLFFKSILNITYDKNNTHLYIYAEPNVNTNLLHKFVNQHGLKFASVYIDNQKSFAYKSIEYAKNKKCDYLYLQSNIILSSHTIQSIQKIKHLGVISPLVVTQNNCEDIHPKGIYVTDRVEYCFYIDWRFNHPTSNTQIRKWTDKRDIYGTMFDSELQIKFMNMTMNNFCVK